MLGGIFCISQLYVLYFVEYRTRAQWWQVGLGGLVRALAAGRTLREVAPALLQPRPACDSVTATGLRLAEPPLLSPLVQVQSGSEEEVK